MKNLILLTITFLIFSHCGPPKAKTIIDKQGNYSIDVLPGWDYQIGDSNVSLTKSIDSEKGVLQISTITSEYSTLDESMYNYLYGITSFFQDARKISDGISDINGIKTIWYRMKASSNGMKQDILLYNVQLEDRQLISMICVAKEEKFGEFEGEFNQLVFSFKQVK